MTPGLPYHDAGLAKQFHEPAVIKIRSLCMVARAVGMENTRDSCCK